MKGNIFFPVSIDINNKNCLVVGAGKIALKKVKKLLEYGAKVELISPEILTEFYNLNIKITKRKFEDRDIEERFLVIAATNDMELNRRISESSMEKGILVNNVTSKDCMNIRFSAIIKNEGCQIAISGSGEPKKIVELKKKLEKILKFCFPQKE